MSNLERYAIQRLVDQAVAAGVDIPDEIRTLATHLSETTWSPGTAWATAHPDDDRVESCCWGAVLDGSERCTCWRPVHDLEQAPPQPITSADDLGVQPTMCGDCAYRKNSPERAEAHEEQALLELPNSINTPFFCHQGIRRAVRWEHPDGRTVLGDPADYQPAHLPGSPVPYRADGQPALLCAGWVARASRNTERLTYVHLR